MVKVSVIVPVYNPGSDIDDCIRSLTGQSLPPAEYEVIFVDDGSTDETPARLDALAAEHENVHVEHIPNSGWPGRPRNVGLDMAQGEFVYFVDNDDWVEPDALERLYDTAVRDGADIVIGKVVGQGKSVPRGLFRSNRSGVALPWTPMLRLLTPHKLFRRAMLDEHGIRFPEGRVRLEDHLFVMHAYFHAERGISVLADHPIYHWVLREDVSNASAGRFDPAGYYGNVRDVLDLVEEHTEPGQLRDELLAHWYRGKMLKRVGGRSFLHRPAAYRRELYEEIRKLALERYDTWAHEHLQYGAQVRSDLLRAGSYDGLMELARFESGLRASATATGVRPTRRGLRLRIDARLDGRRAHLEFTRRGDRLLWVPPAGVDGLTDEQLDATEALEGTHAQVLLVSTTTRAEYALAADIGRRLEPAAEDRVRPVLDVRAPVLPRSAAGGGVLPADEWEVRAVLMVTGFSDQTEVLHDGAPLRLRTTADGKVSVASRDAPRGRVARLLGR